jgi:hypothetical protein
MAETSGYILCAFLFVLTKTSADRYITGVGEIYPCCLGNETNLRMRSCPEGIMQPSDKVTYGTRNMYERSATSKDDVNSNFQRALSFGRIQDVRYSVSQ